PGPDSRFSLEPAEFRAMADAVRCAQRSLGSVHYGPSPEEAKSRRFRRSLFAVEDIPRGEPLSPANVRSIRPADGMHPRHWHEVMGRRAACHITRGTPLAWDLIGPRT
ncbi:MAG TPA: SAF domain-containing protein, partial [Bryobacteraceae bacterium]|nr:SAF domain-containing protein [Bryobacteraceae bacterium]